MILCHDILTCFPHSTYCESECDIIQHHSIRVCAFVSPETSDMSDKDFSYSLGNIFEEDIVPSEVAEEEDMESRSVRAGWCACHSPFERGSRR